MKKSLETLNNIDVTKFYVCTIWKNEIQLQGYATKENLDYCKEIGFENFTFSNGNLEAKKDNLSITLTY